MATKDGKAYLASLRDDRSIYIDGRRITDVVTDSCFRNAIGSVASLYDFQAAPENLEAMTFTSPSSGGRVNLSWLLPKTYGDLVRRRQAIENWSTLSCGMIGRSLRRGWDIYAAFLLLTLACTIMVYLAGRDDLADESNTRILLERPGATLAHAAILQYRPTRTCFSR